VIEQRRARSRFRDWIVLLLRAFCIALLALGLSRPLMQQPPLVSMNASTDTARVLLVDVSQSMLSGRGGVTAWSEAQATAQLYLEASSGTEANVIFVGARSRPVFDSISPNLTALREAVRQSQPRAERADPAAAMEMAGQLFREANAGKKELIIISDFQRSNWATLPLDRIPNDVNIQFHTVAQPITDNVALTSLQFSSDPIVNQPVNLEVELANYSDSDANVRCRIELAGMQRVIEANLRPQSTQTLSESITFENPGWVSGWGKLEGNLDTLASDDQRPLAIRVRPPVQTLLLTKQQPNEIPSAGFYLERGLEIVISGQSTDGALTPERVDAKTQKLTRVHPTKTNVRSWPDADLVVIDHPGSLSQDVIEDLAAKIRRGKGVLYVTAELVDATNLQQLANLLGGDFQPPVTLRPVADAALRQELFVRRVDARQAPFNGLGVASGSSSGTAMDAVRFSGGLATQATTEGLRDQVLAELSDTSALLYVTSVGAGQLAILNTDLGRGN
jgi:hypothetical protein